MKLGVGLKLYQITYLLKNYAFSLFFLTLCCLNIFNREAAQHFMQALSAATNPADKTALQKKISSILDRAEALNGFGFAQLHFG
jgi:hypothetical protein